MSSMTHPTEAGRGGRRALPVIADHGERVEPPVRAERALRAGESVFQRLDAVVQRFVPWEMNPLAQTGAIANTSLLIAIISGILLLFWYSTSVHHAYDSVREMGASPYLAGLVRSVHRYSSDACMLFVLLHALKLFFQRRFGGARWLAWVTGLALLGLLWLIGWLGYWLVWDERGQLVALGTARMLDGLPIFADPLSRSFLVDDNLNSLLFFVVFFLHMLLPLAMGIALWLHITRLSRPWFLTGRWMTTWVVVSTILVSLAFPADVAGAAEMAVRPQAFSMDWWFLAPVALTDRLGAGALWAIVLGSGVVLFSLPWALARGRARVAKVVPARCNACEKCYNDCPYDAIQMVARTDDKPFATQAQVDPQKCIGCGICAGSCDSAGVGLAWFDTIEQRHRIDALVEKALAENREALLALVCNESAGNTLELDELTGRCHELPDWVIVKVPCAGWIHPLTVERAIRRKARGVLIVASGRGSCMYREGNRWTVDRMSGARAPSLRDHKVDVQRVRVTELFRTERRKLLEEAKAFERDLPAAASSPKRPRRLSAGLVLAAAFSVLVWGATKIGYAAPRDSSPTLVVSFKHPGQAAENCREPTAAELEKLPRHMRAKKICERRRSNVRLRVHVDGQLALEKSYEPRGIWHDGNSIAIERIAVPAGTHDVKVELGDTPEVSEMNHAASRNVTLRQRRNVVVLFDKMSGFQWFE